MAIPTAERMRNELLGFKQYKAEVAAGLRDAYEPPEEEEEEKDKDTLFQEMMGSSSKTSAIENETL